MEMRKITDTEQLQWLRQTPDGCFELAADLDMTDICWTPVDFYGTLDGKGHAITNLQVETGENVGFFGILGGKVRDLHLKNAMIFAGGAHYAGILAGVITGSAEGCTVTGHICGGTCVGAMAGKVTGTCIGGTEISSGSGPHEQTGLCADVAMQGRSALAGEVAEHAVVTGLWRDNTYALRLCSETLQARRQKAVDYMRAMATVKWQIDQDLLEYTKNRQICKQYQDYRRGKVYMGIPYAHSGGSLDRFKSAMASENNGVYTAKPDLPNGEYYVGEVAEALASEGIRPKDNYGFTQYMGNDCSSAVSWAWRQISSVDIAEGGCYGRYSGNMIPTEHNRHTHGILPVGDFFACSEDTRQVVAQKGEEAFWESYAKALPGDGLSGYDTSGHVLMLSFDSVVIRNEAGRINPDRSFFVTIEQGPGLYDSKREDLHINQELQEPIQVCWRVDYRYSFRDMARMGHYEDETQQRKICGCDHIYLPITMQALLVEHTPAAVPRVWMQGSTVCSNFYIAATQMEGQPVYTQISHDWHIYREFPVTAVNLAAVHDLKPGNHTAKVHLSNGQIETVTFTI